MIPISYVKSITPLIAGDEICFFMQERWQSEFVVSKLKGTIYPDELHSRCCIFNDEDLIKYKVCAISFADRPNTGTQPVGDDVVVDVVYDGGTKHTVKAKDPGWLTEETENTAATTSWKPNHAAMLADYKKTQEPKEQSCGKDVMPKHFSFAQTAIDTLEGMGYMHNGGQLWKPPIGKTPNFIDDKHEMNAATALYAFAGWLTSMKEPIIFSEKHWATPAADMVASFINLNELKGEVNFDQVKTPSDSVIPRITVEDDRSCDAATDDKPVFTQAMADAGELPPIGCVVEMFDSPSSSYVECEIICHHKKALFIDVVGWDSAFSVSDDSLFRPIDTRSDKQKAADDYWDSMNHDSKVETFEDRVKLAFKAGIAWVGE